MNDLREFPDPFDGFKKGSSEAFRHYFNVHHYRIYCYNLRLTRDKDLARDLTENVFIVLLRLYAQIRDAGHLVRCLYLFSQIAHLLLIKGMISTRELEAELAFYSLDDPDIMDDPDVTRNETLISMQLAVQKLPPNKKEVAELYFFQGLTVKSIADYLRIQEQVVKEHLSEIITWLGDEIAGKNGERNTFWRAVPVVGPLID